MRILISRLFKAIFITVFLTSHTVLAGISIDSSRIIFQAADLQQGQSVGVTSSANSTIPYLVKAQILGNVEGTEIQTPFSVTPALFRLEPNTSNQLKILKTSDQNLPQNKESIFYLRIMAVPAGKGLEVAPRNEVGGTITVSTGSIVKLFYRPQGLSMTQQQAMASLQFSQQGTDLLVSNPSPYYVTLAFLKKGGKSVTLNTKKKNTMIPPFGKMTYPNVSSGKAVTWTAINDFGGKETFNGTL